MKDRILNNWTFRRAIYVALGVFVIIQAVVEKQWYGLVFGGYFASMGLFSFGCAGGNCSITANKESVVKFEEVKTGKM